MKRNITKEIIIIAVFAAIILLFIFPIIIVFINSIKPVGEIISTPFVLPKQPKFSNYIQAWKTINIPKLLRNTSIITIGGITGIILLSSMAAYWNDRYPSVYSKFFSRLIIASIVIPFAALMIPLVKVANVLHLNNSLPGIIVIYWGSGLSFSFFIIQGAVKSIPRELDESAEIDGCGPLRTFWFIIFPLLQNAVVSVVVMDIFFYWNDFMTQLILINNSRFETIQIGINRMFGQFSARWDIALPALVTTMLPLLIVFIVLQKKIMDGIEAGAVKG
jgi:raffinose/stachyose/melibiose transport system permease protein